MTAALALDMPATFVREGKPTDLAYILDVWLALVVRHCRSTYRMQKPALRQRLAASRVLVLALRDDDDAILAFAVVQGRYAVCTYTRSQARRQGYQAAIFRHLANPREFPQ